MKKIILGLVFVLLITGNLQAATGWLKTKPAGSGTYGSPSDLDTFIGENNAALDLMLSNYRRGCYLNYTSSTAMSISAGEVMVSNSDGSIRLMVGNSAALTVTAADLDTGSAFTNSTTHYVYAIASATTDTAFTEKVSTNATSPSGVTYYKKIGAFYANATGTITNVINYDNLKLGDWVAKSSDVAYQASTDGFVVGYGAVTSGYAGYVYTYSDSKTTPTTLRQGFSDASSVANNYPVGVPVKMGDYYKVATSNGATTLYWIPLEQ